MPWSMGRDQRTILLYEVPAAVTEEPIKEPIGKSSAVQALFRGVRLHGGLAILLTFVVMLLR